MPGRRPGMVTGGCGPIGCGCGCGGRTTGVVNRAGGGVHVGFAAGLNLLGAMTIAGSMWCRASRSRPPVVAPMQIGMLVGVGDGAVAVTVTLTGDVCPKPSLTVIVALPFAIDVTVNCPAADDEDDPGDVTFATAALLLFAVKPPV